MSRTPMTFQQLTETLQRYWADQGCLVWLPSNIEVGAGTMNPATFLHVLGPEPWNVVYVEPSLRPDDARYGENPNRLGRHHQLQVILKPDPGDPQQLYLDSLSAIGIDLAKHDVRFVEDNWASPALGAWGLGWEVWLDGLEITQFTYFQQAGSQDLEPVSVEITYGLDRILMALQDVQHFRDLRWNERVSFGDLFLDYEVQTSRYYFEHAHVERLVQLYDLYEAEARHAMEHGLTRVGHDYVLKCSHIFNVLDARGTIGVTERARYFGRMRDLARAVARGYVDERREAEYPLLDEDEAWLAGTNAAAGEAEDPGTPPQAPAELVLEIGTEEMPPDDVRAALDALRARATELLDELRLVHGPIRVDGTPRRIALRVQGLAPRQTDVEEHVVGPPARAAYDAEGRPTRAAEGFARKMGVAVDELERVERGGEERVAALRREQGQPATDVLIEPLAELLSGLPFGRAMRWNASRQAFSRPVRWLVALHGEALLPLRFAGLHAGRTTRGLRPDGSPRARIAEAGDYGKMMRTLGIEVDPEARSSRIRAQVSAAAEAAGGRAAEDESLQAELCQLVEQPHAILGRFDERFLDLPDALLVTVMRKHQRYVPVREREGDALLPAFVTVANGAGLDEAAVRHGNEAVIRARFTDAAYFWDQDRKQELDAYTPLLDGLTFQTELGSMRDKVRRLESLVEDLGEALEADPSVRAHAGRAARLSKSDLVTSMVVDFTSLQGVMGREYALHGGEPSAVAEAIYEQYLPRGAGDELPRSEPGVLLALTDRLDSLVGLFAAGLRPTGAQDPYALRRSALGLMRILTERDIPLDLDWAVDTAAARLPIPLSPEMRDELLEFLRTRLEGQLRDAGHAADAVAAVLAVQAARPAQAVRTLEALEARVGDEGWAETLTAYARCARIVRGAESGAAEEPDAALLIGAEERALLEAVDEAEAGLDRADAAAVLDRLAALRAPIDAFFDAVLVMDEDESVRKSRLALVRRIAALPADVADLARMEGF